MKRLERLESLDAAPVVTVTDRDRAKALARFATLEPDEVERRLMEPPLFLRGLVFKARAMLNGGRRVSIA